MNGHYYGCADDGIYELGGPEAEYKDDNGTDIDVTIGKEKIDLGTMLEKRIEKLYVNLESAGDLTLEIIADVKSQLYALTNGFPGLHVLPFTPGKGLKGKFLDWTLKNHRGSDITLNEIEFLIDVLSRRAHND